MEILKGSMKKLFFVFAFIFITSGLLAQKTIPRYALVDSNGKELTPFVYNRIEPLPGGYFQVTKTMKRNKEGVGIVDARGKEIIAAENKYIIYFDTKSALAVASRNVDKKKRWDYIDKWGVIDTLGNEVIPFDKYITLHYNDDGTLIANQWNGKYDGQYRQNKMGLIDMRDNVLLPFEYDALQFLSINKDYLLATKRIENKPDSSRIFSLGDHYDANVIDKQGNILFPFGNYGIIGRVDNYIHIYEKNDNNHMVKTMGMIPRPRLSNFALMDIKGNIIMTYCNDHELNFKNGFATQVDEYKKSGVIDITGKKVVPNRYQHVYQFTNGLARVSTGYQEMGVIDTLGNEIIPCEYYDTQLSENSNIIILRKKDKEGAANRAGEIIIPMGDNYIQTVSKNYALVYKDNTYTLVDVTGAVIRTYPYTEMRYEADYFLSAKNSYDGWSGLVDCLEDITYIPFIYKYIDPLQSIPESEPVKYFKVGKSIGEIGVVDIYGKEIVPCIYDDINSISNNIFIVRKDSKK